MSFLPVAVTVAILALLHAGWRWLAGQRGADRRFEEALEAAPSGMMVVEKTGVISFANSEAHRMFACRKLAGLSIEDLVPASIRGAHADLRERYQAAPERRAMGEGRDLIALGRDGREFPVEIGLNPISLGGEGATLAAIVDITARKQAEAALLRSNSELEQFAYLASHDMQEPLRMVASYTQLLSERYKGQLDERADRYINYATEGAVRMQALVRDLLSYSRLSAERREPVAVNLADAVKEALAPLRDEIARTGGEILVEELPPVSGDKAQLVRVFQNLIGNAQKFRGPAPLRVRIRGERRGPMVVVSVEDNGIGIEPRNFERIFLMFQRLHERGKYEGSGIGLAIVKKIVEGHGGEVWIESAPGEGAKIYLTLQGASVGDAPHALVASGG